MNVKLKSFLYIASLFSAVSLFGQVPSSLVGKTVTYNYQGPDESGTANFQFLAGNVGWIYDDGGEWESMTYEWSPSTDTAQLKIVFADDEYLVTSMSFRENPFVINSDRGTATYSYFEMEEPGSPPLEEQGTGDFTISTTTQNPPIGRYFEDDFSNISTTRTNFGLGDGDSEDGLTVVQDPENGVYSVRGIYVDHDGDDSDDPDRWIELHGKTILPMNRSWIVEAELFTDEFNSTNLAQIDYMRTAIELDFSWGNFHIGASYNGYEFRHHAGIWNEVAWRYDSATAPVDSNAINTTYRLTNRAMDYELLFQVVETYESESGPYTTESTLIRLEWDDGWYFKNDYGYAEWRQLDNWESIGDQYVQPSMSFELPHSWSNGHGSELTMYDLQGGEIGFRRFSVQGDPEIIEFDGDPDIPLFYNNLDNEVDLGGSNSRYHLLKGLHELAQVVESTQSNSLKQFAVSFGVDSSILQFSLADTPLAGTFEFELDRDFQTGELADFVQYGLIPRLESIDNHFSQVTETVTMATSMTGAEEEIIADATDVKVLRAMVNVLASIASLQSAYDWDYNIGDLLDLDMGLTETSLQEVRQKHPTLFGVRSVSQLAKSKEFLRTAISTYKEASNGLRAAGRFTTEQDWIDGTEPSFLFVLDQYDFVDEQQFIDDLNELLVALDNDYVITDGEFPGTVVSLSAFFDGGLNLPVLLPSSIEDQFSSDELTDPTIGGILPNATYASSEFLQEVRKDFYEDELVYGQPVRHDSLKEALKEFDYLTYLDLNPMLGEWYQTEANAKQHFAERGFWDEYRYFYYPFESPSQNLVSEKLVGQKVSTTGTIADLDNLNFTITHYFVDSIHAITHYNSNNPSIMEEHWSKEKYFFKRLGRDSANFALINNTGDKLIADIFFQNLGSGTTNLQFIENGGNVAWSQGTGNWLVSEFSLSEIPLDLQDEPIFTDYAPSSISEGLGYSQPLLENNDTFWPGYAESINFQDYGNQHYTNKNFNSQVTFPADNGSEYDWDNGQFDYFKTGPNSATLILRFPDNYNWHADERRFVYNLQFTGENTGNYVKYSDYISQADVTTGPFVFKNLSATSLFAWEDYDDFESGIIDTEKWETGYFSGGREPRIASWTGGNRKEVQLWGESYSDSEPTKLPESATSPEWQNVLTDSAGEGNSGILIFDDSIIGVQAKLLLDYSNVEQAGVFISAMFSGGGIELVKRGEWFDESNSYSTYEPYFSYDIQDETGAIVGKKMRANTGSWYEVAVIRKNNKSLVFVDGEKLSEIDSPIEPEAWIIGAFNDAGQPFSAYVDDVRVLRRSDTEFNADALVADEISAQRDLVYLQTENGPELIEGAGEINFEIFLPQQPEITTATLEVDGVSYNLIEDQGPTVFRTRYGFGLGETNELYDIESSSDSDWSAYVNGKSFNFSLTHNGVDYTYSHQLPGASALPSAPNLSINGVGNWKIDAEEGHSYLELIPAQNVVVSWEPFQTDDEHDHIFIALSEWINEDDEVDVFEHVLSNDSTHFQFSRDLLTPGNKYSLYVEFANSTEGYNPQGFRRAYLIDDEPILVTHASTITAIDMEIGNPLDGSVVFIDTNFDDAVIQPKWTASFENGLVTTTWENPDDGELVVNTVSYTFEDLSANSFQVTLEDGDILTFNTATGTGSLTDYDSNGVIDTSGSWDFTFRIYNWEDYDDFSDNSLDGEKWLSSTEFFQGNVPIETNQEIRLEGYTSANPIDNTFLIFKDLDGIVGVEADIWLPENAPVETAVLLGIADGGTPLGSLDLWNNNGNAVMYIDLENFETNEVISNSRNAALGTKYRVGLVKDGGKTKLLLDGEKVAEVTTTHSENINLLFRGESDATDPAPYSVYLDNVRVLRGQEYIEPVTVVRDRLGNPVVNKVGLEYRWNNTLDGVTMWALGTGEQGIYKAGTTKFENGEQLIVFDQMVDDINGNETYRNPYTIDENGYLKVTESVYQYYNVVGAKDGKISIIEGSNGIESVADNGTNKVTMHWFTTREAAEKFYQTQKTASEWEQYDDFSGSVNTPPSGGYAPESIVGYVINSVTNFSSGLEYRTYTFSDNRIVYQENGSYTYYDYVRLSANQAKITYTFEDEANPMPEVVTLTFNSPTEGTFTWVEYRNSSMIFKNDEASGSWSVPQSLDEQKWDVSQWDGGFVPVLDNGRLKFSGQPNSPNSVGIATKAMLRVDPNADLNDPESAQPHSIIEFVESNEIKGIELTFSIPANSPNLMGFGLFAVDYDAMFNASNHDEEMSALRFEFDFWNEDGSNAELGFYAKDPITDQESSVYRDIDFDTPYRVAFVREESSVRFYLDDELIGEYPYQERGEYFIVRAMNEVNQPFTTYLDNVRVIRRDPVGTSPDSLAGLMVRYQEIEYDYNTGAEIEQGWEEVKISDNQVIRWDEDDQRIVFDSYTYAKTGPSTGSLIISNVNEQFTLNLSFQSNMNGVGDWIEIDNEGTFSGSLEFELLPQSTVAPVLDGMVIYIDSEDPVKETLIFDSGTMTSIYDEENGQNIHRIEGIQYEYYQVNENQYSIILEGGDQYVFNNSTNKGKLWDYNDNGELDESGTWNFTFETGDISGIPVTVVRDPSGRPVVNKLGDEYLWNDSLEGITLWSVDLSGGYLQSITMRFENGRNFGNTGFYDQVALPQPYNHEYIINSDGYIQVTEDNGYQYYHVIDVEDGVIATLEGDEQGVIDDGISFADQWFFTTREAAEKFFDAKAIASKWEQYDFSGSLVTPPTSGYAPESIVGYVINSVTNFSSGPEYSTHTFSDNRIVYQENGSYTYYDYVRLSANQAKITYTFEDEPNPMPEVVTLTFNSPTEGTFTWVEYRNSSMVFKGDEASGTWTVAESLDEQKWDVAQFDGGLVPVLENGRVKFSGQPYSVNSQAIATDAMIAIDPDYMFQDPADPQPHSILEFVESQNLKGIELTFSIPSSSTDYLEFGLIGIDYRSYMTAENDEQEKSALRLAVQKGENSENGKVMFGIRDGNDAVTEFYEDIQFDVPFRAAFIREETAIRFYLNDKLVGEYPYEDRGEHFLIRAHNYEIDQPFTTYLDNVRVIRREYIPDHGEWVLYDDFSGNQLDPNKWESWWWDGANAPRISNGALELGGTGNLSDAGSPTVPDEFSHILLENESRHSIALLKDESINGLEAEFMIPSGSDYTTGLNLLCFDIPEDGNQQNIKQFGPELEYWEGEGLVLEFSYTDPSTGQKVEVTRPAEFDTYYRMSSIHTDSTNSMYLNDELIVEFPSDGFVADAYGFFAFNDDGYAFSTFVDNVRVLRGGKLDPVNEIYVSGGSLSAPYYTFSDEKGPIDIATYEFGAGEDYRFTAVDGFNPHNFNIGAMPGITSLYVTGDPLSAVGDELTLSIPSDYSTLANTLYFYCVTHSSTMNGQLNVVEAAPTPESLAGTKYRWKTFETLGDGTEIQTPWDEARYTQTHVERWDHTASALISDPYSYTKTGPNTATVVIQEGYGSVTHYAVFDNRYEGSANSTSVSNSGTYDFRMIFEQIEEFSDNNPLKNIMPVFWISAELFNEITGTNWDWTSFAGFEDPSLGRGTYFAIKEVFYGNTSFPGAEDLEIHSSYDLLHVSELIAVGEAPVWIASPNMEIYNTEVSPESLVSDRNLTTQGYYIPPKLDDVRGLVEGFFAEFKNSQLGASINPDVYVVYADKQFDVISRNRAVYLAELSNQNLIFFDQDGNYIHSSNSSYGEWFRSQDIPESVLSSVQNEMPNSVILELWEESSILNPESFVYRAIAESNSSGLYEFYTNQNGEIQLVSNFYGAIERQFPQAAHDYMNENFRWEDDNTSMPYWTWFDEFSKEFIAVLDDSREVFFNQMGEFLRVIDPIIVPQDAEIIFNPDRSAWGTDLTINNFDGSSTGGTQPAYVKIDKIELNNAQEHLSHDDYGMPRLWLEQWDDMAYRVSIVNSQLGEDDNVSLNHLELGSTVLPAGTPLKLSFTYESGEPRYFLVSGAKISGYKHTMPEYWMDRPGSFTIIAETTRTISTTDGNLDSTFGLVVVMGGERWYNGAIFQANVPVLELEPSNTISPYDQVAAFSVSSDVLEDANVSAFLPRDLLEWKFGISEPHRVKAGLVDANGSLYFINGSGANEEGASFTGGGFTRILHEGYEPEIYIDPGMAGSYPVADNVADVYKLGDYESDSGLLASQPSEDPNLKVKQSRFDFNADGYADSLLEVRFFADIFPSEVGFGDPYVEPSLAGTVSGYILDESNNTIDDFGLWFFEAPEGLNGPWEPAYFELDINHSSGYFTAKLPEGTFYAEAWGHDFDDFIAVPYKPQISTTSFSISSGSELDYNFSLEKEYVPGGDYGDITAKLIVEGQDVGEHFDVSIELFPVDQSNQSLSDWSVAWLWVEPGGKISGSAPAGRYKVVINSYDNSIRLNGGPVYWDIEADKLNDLGTLTASKSLPIRVSGKISDAVSGDGIWAEVVFVDPNDEHRIFWPTWDNFDLGGDSNTSANGQDLVSFAPGVYSVRIPAGIYKIKAVDWSGFYSEEYYKQGTTGTADFSDASDVNITNDLADINFTLSSGSVAEVRVNVTDDNTSDAYPYAWFDFFDAYDEYGPVSFPRVNYTDDGNYSLKISEGSYKLAIGSSEHRSVFLHTDVEGNYTWKEGDWSSAAIMDVSSNQTIILPNAELERWEIILPPPPPGDNSISGKVLTSKGVGVPKATIQCYTDDWMFWFEATSRSDGSFKFENLPTGAWILEAHPPYDSSEFTGLQPALPNWENKIELGTGDSVDYNLILKGSNVSGRILYPKKEDNDRVKLKPLPFAYLWAFEDENETGEPPFFNYLLTGQPTFNEAYGDTDEDGFFSFSLNEAGKYSLRIEIPSELGSFSIDPIHFEIRDPNQEMTLGNAIRVDWSKATAKASTYKLERKSSSSNTYSTVDDNISGSLKSYVDHTVVPGTAYEYRVTAVSSGGSQVLSTDAFKVSKPFIYLAPPSKSIVGKVINDLNASISGAEVQAWKIDGTGWASTLTDTNGNYELNVGAGKWEVMVYQPWDRKVNWNYDKAPKQVTFADNSKKVEKRVNFTVSTMSGGISGIINIPSDMAEYYSYIWVDVYNPDGMGNWTNPESNGSFSMALVPGEYELSVWLDPAVFSGYSSPEPRVIKVGKSELDLGTIILTQFVPTKIVGVVATTDGTPLGNANVWGWSFEGGWAEDTTDSNGSYELSVSPGNWEIGLTPPMPRDGSASPYLPVPQKKIKVGDSDRILNFTVRKAGAKVKGVVNGPSGSPVSDLYAWAYAREFTDVNSSQEFTDILAEVEVSSRGEFSFPAVPGTYAVGLWIFSDEYLVPEEQVFTLSDNNILTDQNNTTIDKITFNLSEVNSYVIGSLIDKESNQSIQNLIGEVYAMSLDGHGWQYAAIDSNGSYSMLLSPGDWILEYYLEDDQGRNYPNGSVTPVNVSTIEGTTVTANFLLTAASSTISGAVVFDLNSSAVTDSSLYIWAYRKESNLFPEYWNEVQISQDGSFSLSVLQGGKYEIGLYLSSDLRDDDYLEPAIQKVTMNSATKRGVEFRLAKPAEENYISGFVSDEIGTRLVGAKVYAWTFDGGETSTTTDANGDFNVSVTAGSLWKVGAEYIEFDDNGSEIVYFIDEELDANLRKNVSVDGLALILKRPTFDVPDGKSVTFDPNKDFITTLPDGTEITIPAGAVNVSSNVDTVRLVVTPTASGLDKSGAVKPANYVYSLELFDNKGKLIEGNFKKDVIIRMPIDVEAFRSKGLNADTIEGTFYSATKKAWVKSKTSTWDKESGILTMTTNHFSEKGASAESVNSPLANDDNSSALSGYDKWYQSDWLGTFYDASVDSESWYYHTDEKLGWLWVTKDNEGKGNYWFYHTKQGWLWSGSDYFVQGNKDKSHFFSYSLNRWLYFHPTKGFYDYQLNGGSYLD